MNRPKLELINISKSFGQVCVLQNIFLTLMPGEFVTLVGPSGCGKTSLLRIIAGLIKPDAGQVIVDGVDVVPMPTYQRNMGMVFQSFALFPHLTVAQNLAFPLRIRHTSRDNQLKLIKEALELVHLEHVANFYPRQLSGGQQQRVGLARALIYRPSIILFDEPLSNLDAKLREELRHEISEIIRELAITALYVTHDQQEALSISDRVAVINHGVILQLDSPNEVYFNPSNPFVATFVSGFNAVPVAFEDRGLARIDGAHGHFYSPAFSGEEGATTLYIHPRDITLNSYDGQEPRRNEMLGVVQDTAFSGGQIDYVVKVGDLSLKVEVSMLGSDKGMLTFARGQSVVMHFVPERWKELKEGIDQGK